MAYQRLTKNIVFTFTEGRKKAAKNISILMLSVDLQRLVGTLGMVFGFQSGSFSISCWNQGVVFRTKIVDLNKEEASTPKKAVPSKSNALEP